MRRKLSFIDDSTCSSNPLFRIAYYAIQDAKDASLLDTLQQGRVRGVEEVINGETPLSMSLYYDGPEVYHNIAKALINAGASVTQTSKYYSGTALHRMSSSRSLMMFMLELHNVQWDGALQKAYTRFAEEYLSKNAPEYAGKLELYRS